jgi:hypothetical protein
VREPTHESDSRATIEAWELAQIRLAAGRIRTNHRDELEAELARKLLVLKIQQRSDIRNWKLFLAKFLRNKASNWIRDQRTREAKTSSLDSSTEDNDDAVIGLAEILPSREPEPDRRIAFRLAWGELDPDLRFLCKALLEENGNQVRVARRLGLHRNTIRFRIKKIQQVLKRHGFSSE